MKISDEDRVTRCKTRKSGIQILKFEKFQNSSFEIQKKNEKSTSVENGKK
jgi:hypothetical protein